MAEDTEHKEEPSPLSEEEVEALSEKFTASWEAADSTHAGPAGAPALPPPGRPNLKRTMLGMPPYSPDAPPTASESDRTATPESTEAIDVDVEVEELPRQKTLLGIQAPDPAFVKKVAESFVVPGAAIPTPVYGGKPSAAAAPEAEPATIRVQTPEAEPPTVRVQAPEAEPATVRVQPSEAAPAPEAAPATEQLALTSQSSSPAESADGVSSPPEPAADEASAAPELREPPAVVEPPALVPLAAEPPPAELQPEPVAPHSHGSAGSAVLSVDTEWPEETPGPPPIAALSPNALAPAAAPDASEVPPPLNPMAPLLTPSAVMAPAIATGSVITAPVVTAPAVAAASELAPRVASPIGPAATPTGLGPVPQGPGLFGWGDPRAAAPVKPTPMPPRVESAPTLGISPRMVTVRMGSMTTTEPAPNAAPAPNAPLAPNAQPAVEAPLAPSPQPVATSTAAKPSDAQQLFPEESTLPTGMVPGRPPPPVGPAQLQSYAPPVAPPPPLGSSPTNEKTIVIDDASSRTPEEEARVVATRLAQRADTLPPQRPRLEIEIPPEFQRSGKRGLWVVGALSVVIVGGALFMLNSGNDTSPKPEEPSATAVKAVTPEPKPAPEQPVAAAQAVDEAADEAPGADADSESPSGVDATASSPTAVAPVAKPKAVSAPANKPVTTAPKKPASTTTTTTKPTATPPSKTTKVKKPPRPASKTIVRDAPF